MPERKPNVLRPITPEMEAGLVPAGWSWEQNGGMCNCFPYDPGWDRRSDEGNRYWAEKGFAAPRPLYFQTNLQRAAPDLLQALIEVTASLEWHAHGRCRGINDGPIMPSAMAVEMARSAIAKATGQA